MNVTLVDSTSDPLPDISELASETSELIVDLTGQVQGGFSPLDLAHDRLNSSALTVLGMSSSLNIFMGPVRILHGVKEMKLSQQLKDYWGEVQGYLKAVQGGFQTAAGAAYLPASALLTALFFTTCKVMSVAANVLTAIGGGLLAAVSAVQMIVYSIALHHALNIRKLVQKALEENSPQEALKVVQDEVAVESFNFERALG
ncbi:MAG: hypothetical protein K940chlam2_00719, partial [Chlamydiae bacterium]|nr:hypothetical protein [Chlamydiota bacterium]